MTELDVCWVGELTRKYENDTKVGGIVNSRYNLEEIPEVWIKISELRFQIRLTKN